jgi:hypothetical protein
MSGSTSKRLLRIGVPLADEVPTVPRNQQIPSVPAVPATQPPVPTQVPIFPAVDSADSRNPIVPMVPRTSKAARSRASRALAQLNVAIPVEMVDALRDLAREERRSAGDIIEELLFVRLGPRLSASGVPVVPRNGSMIDDLMTDDVASALNIIDHQYRLFLGTPLTEKDRVAVAQFVSEHGTPDESAVQIGMTTTLMRTSETNISSVRYFFNEIRKAMDMPEESRRTMAAARLWRWKREGK